MTNHEAYVIGALLVSPLEALRLCEGLITPESFTSNTYAALWQSALELRQEGEGADVVMVTNRAKTKGVSLTREELKEHIAIVPSSQLSLGTRKRLPKHRRLAISAP